MKQIWSRRLPIFLFCTVILLTLCSCQKSEQLDHPPLNDESVAYMESLYGMTQEDVMKELGLSEKDITEKIGGLVQINEPVVIEGKEFTKALTIVFRSDDMESGRLCSVQYRYDCENAEEAAEVAEAVCLAVVEEHGLPEDNPNLLSNMEIFDEIKNYKKSGWGEMWRYIGEVSWLRMEVAVFEKDEWFTVELKYNVLPEEWHHFDPEYKAPHYPPIRIRYPDDEDIP